jgi:hypothetical protein
MAAIQQTTDTPHALPHGEIGVWGRMGPQENSNRDRSQNTSVQGNRVVRIERFEAFDRNSLTAISSGVFRIEGN